MTNIILTPELNRYVNPDGNIKIEYTDALYYGKLNDRGEFHGIGNYLDKFGNYYTGEFNNGKKCGSCVEEWWGTRFEGSYIDNKRNGRGREIYKDGDYSVGNYIDNKRGGLFAFTKPDGSTLTRTYNSEGGLIAEDGRYIMSGHIIM